MNRFGTTAFGRLVLAAVVLGAIAAAPARAQDRAYEGTFTLVPDSSDDLARAIAAATDHMNFIVKRIARGRLKGTNEAYRWVTITFPPSEVAIGYAGRDPIVTPATGRAIEWEREDGELLDVSTAWRNGALEQTFVAEDGTRQNVFRRQGDELHMHVTVTSPKLQRPLTYTLVYERR